MKIDVEMKNVHSLIPTDILFQTKYWGRVKSILGWQPMAFDFESSGGQCGDLLVLVRPLSRNLATAFVPQGPESEPDPEQYGLFLETLSNELMKYFHSSVAFVRYDLPWRAPYPNNMMNKNRPYQRPALKQRELRMNIGTKTWNLRKAVIDYTVADSLLIHLEKNDADLLARMKPKTRYNIRLAHKRGVYVFEAPKNKLRVFYHLYLQTAKRNGFIPCSYRHCSALFHESCDCDESYEPLFLLAACGNDILAGAIITISGQRGLFLFGASANEQRNLMASYALQWEIMKMLKDKGCRIYDMGAVSPCAENNHPFFGMYRFKTGFGGCIFHRNGSWDYPYKMEDYKAFSNYESLSDATSLI